VRQLPNLLTWARIALTPVCVYLVLTGRFGPAFPWTLIAGLTDAADGWAARRLGVESRFGARMDPVADKFLLISLYVAFGLVAMVPQWLVWLVVGRDILILGMVAAGLAFTRLRDFPPTRWGKLSTILQIAGVLVLLRHLSGPVHTVTVWLVASATAWSGVHYVWRAVVLTRAARQIV
jgi:cardiolipin synthase (CMP-forming)